MTSSVMTRFAVVVALAVMMMVTMILLPPPMLPLALLTPMAALVLVVDCAHDGRADREYVLVGRSGCGARVRRDAMR